jgi:uncharacterized protein YndB with AHSA1/START domain
VVAVTGRIVRLAGFVTALAIAVDRLLGARSASVAERPIETFVVVDAPIQRVWSEIADVEGQPRWMRDLKRVRLLTPGPIGVGTRADGTVGIVGIRVHDPVTITRFEPPTAFAISHDGAFGGRGLLTLEPGADGSSTIVRWQESLIPPMLPRLGARVLRPLLREVFQADLHRLRALLEG